IDNLSSLVAEAVEVEFYLSGNDWISDTDFKLGSVTIDSIAAASNSGTQVATLNLPSDAEAFWRLKEDGTYFVGMIVKGKNEANQASNFYTGNNAQFVDHDAIEINVSNIVDLTGESFNAVIEAGSTANIDFSISNLGDGAAGKFTVDFYISNNEYISTNDAFLGSFRVDGLAANSSTNNFSTSFALPSTNDEFWFPKGAGAYYVGMVINPTQTVDETFKFANNSNQGEFIDKEGVVVDNPQWVDLGAFDFNVVQESIFDSFNPGQTIEVEYGIGNTELNPVQQDFSVSFYISTDANIATTDTFLSSVRVESAEDLIGTTALVLPDADAELWTKETERLFVGMIVDSDNEIAETDETNNSNLGELIDYDGTGGFFDEFKAPLPDLVMESFKVDSDIVAAQAGTIDLEFAISNLATGSAAPFTVEFYISDNEYISTNDFRLGAYDFTAGFTEGLSSSEVINLAFDLPDATERFWTFQGNGTYHVGAIIDPDQEIAEFSESNNSNFGYGFDQDVVQVKDLAFSDLIGERFEIAQDGFLQPGDSIDVGFEILNQGQADAGAFTVDFYISNNEYISTNDRKIGSFDLASLAGDSSTGALTTTYQLPDADDGIWEALDGTYYVGMLIDPANEVAEVTQLNNNNQGQFVDSDTILIREPNEDSDLFGVNFDVVEVASETEPLIPGQEINLEYEVYNQGGQDVEFSAVGFYLFTEEYLNSRESIAFDDTFEDNSEIIFLFGDRASNLIDIEGYQTSGKLELETELPTEWDAFERVGDGYYYIGMVSDQWEEVAETDEFNNSLTAEFLDYEKVYLDVV
ncbi:MAG TPA: CARDB domain-containing protein, partial [Xenococcaceae cyanobacterium]